MTGDKGDPKGGKGKIAADPAPLSHNPFAQALAGTSAPASPPAPATPAAPPSTSSAAAAPVLPLQRAEKIVVRKERKGHGGKTVTLVEGVPKALVDDLCGELKRALGCGARVEDGAIVLQGELVDRAVPLLEKKGARRIVRGG